MCHNLHIALYEPQQLENGDSKENESQRSTEHEACGNKLKESVCTGLALTAAQVLQGEVTIGVGHSNSGI